MSASNVLVNKAYTTTEIETVFGIRKTVFVDEQQVPAELEYDEFDNTAPHFLAVVNGTGCGTARWRFTDNGVKLERFAVLAPFRSSGVGTALVKAVISDIKNHSAYTNQKLYLHSQVSAMGLYAKAGFEPVGELFYEADIPHYKMVLV